MAAAVLMIQLFILQQVKWALAVLERVEWELIIARKVLMPFHILNPLLIKRHGLICQYVISLIIVKCTVNF